MKNQFLSNLAFTGLLLSLFSSNIVAQLPWSPPQLLCDSIGDNRYPSFVKYYDEFFEYNIMLWSRDFGSYAGIFMKNFADPDTEIAVDPFSAGGFSQHPKGTQIYDSSQNVQLLIVWQSDRGGNFDLLSVVYQNHRFSNYQRITQNPLDDTYPDLWGEYLVWQRDSCILFSRYSRQTMAWEPEFVVDSGGCARPAVKGIWGLFSYLSPVVVYEKETGDSTQIFMRVRENDQNWTAARNVSHVGENRHPVFSTGFESPVMWEYRQADDWNLKFYSIGLEDTASIRFSHHNETSICGLTVPQITDQFAPMLIAFQSDSGGNPDIYSHTMPYAYLYSYNISQYPGPDINPCFSGPAWGEATVYHVRYRVAWEREKSAGNQIWGSYSEMAFGEIDPGSQIPVDQISLDQNFPNPFNGQTFVRFNIPRMSVVKIDIFDIGGRKIKNLLSSPCSAGEHSVFWDGRDEQGRNVASGIYFSRLTSGRSVITRKMMIIR